MKAAGEEERFRLSFELAPYPAAMLDCDLIILACNAAYERAAHVNRAAMISRDMPPNL